MGGYTRAVSGQRLGKHIPAASDMHATGTVFSTWSVLRCYKQGTRLELSQLYPGRYEYGDLALQFGEGGGRESETVKCGHQSRGTRT
jgi:hypothetical protein